MEEKPKKIEIIAGDSTNLDISPVYDHLNAVKPNTNLPNEKIVVPKIKKKNKKNEKNKEK